MKKIKNKYLIQATIALLLGIGVGYIIGGLLIPREIEVPISNTKTNSEKTNEINIDNSSDDPFLGYKDAKVVLVEYSDFQCLFCRDYYKESYEDLKIKYADTNKIKYIFRDYPLNEHPQAILAATAANCTIQYDKYWEMHNLIFENQDDWSYQDDAKEKLISYAIQLEIDEKEFTNCIEKEETDEIYKDISDAHKEYVRSTPTFFINETKIVGTQPTKIYEEAINAELEKIENSN